MPKCCKHNSINTKPLTEQLGVTIFLHFELEVLVITDRNDKTVIFLIYKLPERNVKRNLKTNLEALEHSARPMLK